MRLIIVNIREQIGLVNGCEILTCSLSDHLPLLISLSLEEQMRGRGYWKLNNSLLKEKAYVDEINLLIDKSLEENKYKNFCMQWEILKWQVEEFSQYYGKKRASDRKKKKIELERKLRTQEKRLCCINLQSLSATQLIKKNQC